MTMMFDSETGELNPFEPIGVSFGAYVGWTPYYNLEGKYVGYKCSGCDCEYSLPDMTYVYSYEALDW